MGPFSGFRTRPIGSLGRRTGCSQGRCSRPVCSEVIMSKNQNSPNRYYLFKAGQLSGPFSADRVNQMRASRELNTYSWIIDEGSQKWSPVDDMPKNNPFEASLKSLSD